MQPAILSHIGLCNVYWLWIWALNGSKYQPHIDAIIFMMMIMAATIINTGIDFLIRWVPLLHTFLLTTGNDTHANTYNNPGIIWMATLPTLMVHGLKLDIFFVYMFTHKITRTTTTRMHRFHLVKQNLWSHGYFVNWQHRYYSLKHYGTQKMPSRYLAYFGLNDRPATGPKVDSQVIM